MSYKKTIILTTLYIKLGAILGTILGIFIGFYLASQNEKKDLIAERKAFQALYKKTNPYKHIKNLPRNEDLIKEDIRKLENTKAAFAKEEQPYAKGWFNRERSEALRAMRQTRSILLATQTSMLIFLEQYISIVKAIKKGVGFLMRIVAITLLIVGSSLAIFLIRKSFR